MTDKEREARDYAEHRLTFGDIDCDMEHLSREEAKAILIQQAMDYDLATLIKINNSYAIAG